MRLIIVVQARLNSARFPRKVLADLGGKPVLEHLLLRMSLVPNVDGVVLAIGPNDDELMDCRPSPNIYCLNYPNEWNVLGRYRAVVTEWPADAIVRITADCPLLDPRLVEECVRQYREFESPRDYFHIEGYPRGLGDVEIISTEALRIADQEATSDYDREHVVTYTMAHPERFNVVIKPAPAYWKRLYRLCVDELADLEVVRAVYAAIGGPYAIPSVRDIVRFLDARPEIAAINAKVVQVS